jgi:recombination protein RecT
MGGKIVPKKEKFNIIKDKLAEPDTIQRIARALPRHITPEKMTSVFLTACTTTPELLNCNPASLLKAVVEASQLGLLPDGVLGHGYILPYKDQAKFIPGFRGLIDLARRSGKIAWIQARVVYENDHFEYSYGANPTLEHVPAQAIGNEPGEFHAVYAAAKFKDSGEVAFEVMYREDVEKIRKGSPAGKRGPWVTHYEEMARKTAVRRLMKYLPLSPEVQEAVMVDEYAEAGILEKYLAENAQEDAIADKASALDDFTDEIADAEFEEEKEEEEESDDPVPEAKGKITNDEDDAYINAIEDLQDRAVSTVGEDRWSEFFYRTLGGYGVEDPMEIRSRDERRRFYKDLNDMVVGWEDLAD